VLSTVLLVNFNKTYRPWITSIRNSVFTVEQLVDSNIDFDGQDDGAIHVLIRRNNDYIATGRMLSDGHIGRVAVLKEYREHGYGFKIVSALINEAKNKYLNRVYLGAQLHAIDFYLKLGFLPYGEPYVEANIEHISMEIIFNQ